MSLLTLLSGKSYSDKVKATGPIAYWPLNELAGTTVYDLSGNGRNGTSTGVTLGSPGIGDGNTAPLFDGVNDFVNVYSTSLRDAFSGAEGTMLVWVQVSAAGIWTDGQSHYIANLLVDGNNFISIYKDSANNTVKLIRCAGGTYSIVTIAGQSSTGWLTFALSWSASGDAVKGYAAGVQSGTTKTVIGTWAGQLAANSAVVGAYNTNPSAPWSGLIGPVALYNRALPATVITSISAVS